MARPSRLRSLPAVLAALVFAALIALPWIHATNTTPPWVAAAKSSSPVSVPAGPPALPPVALPASAQPSDPRGPIASPPGGDATYLPILVTGEENRLRLMLHSTTHMVAPGVIDFPGSVATLVLPARTRPYTLSDLVEAGAAVPWTKPGSFLLVDSVFVAPSADLEIGGSQIRSLLLNTSPSHFTSIVTWEGTLTLSGTAARPLQITGWNNGPATNPDFGRPYLRAVGGQMTLTYVQASSLGFWEGATGGVSWTATSYRPATGGATASSFVGDTYGAFTSGSLNVQFADDLFESNQVDGIRLEANSDNSTVANSAAVRNGGNGFAISQGSHDVLTHDVAIHNAGNGFMLDAQTQISAASFSGTRTQPLAGLVVEHSLAKLNGRAGILVEGGAETEVRANAVCDSATGIAVRLGAVDTGVIGNDVDCGTRIGVAVGPAVDGTLLASNAISHSDIGVMVESAPQTRLLDNHLAALSVFGVSVRGASQGVVGNGNVIAGRGFAPVQTAYGATAPNFTASNTVGWSRRTTVTPIDYLRYHPLLMTWTIILGLVALFCIFTRLRVRSDRPYRHVVPWAPSAAAELPYGEVPGTPVDGSPGTVGPQPGTSPPLRRQQPAAAILRSAKASDDTREQAQERLPGIG